MPTRIELYLSGAPKELVEAKPLKEREIAIPLTHVWAPELAKIIRRLREDMVAMTQLRVDFDKHVAWVVPTTGWGGGYLLVFKTEKLVVGSARGAPMVPELKEKHELLRVKYREPEWKVEKNYRPDLDKWFFWAIRERKSVFRADPYLMARDVLDLKPTRVSVQTLKRFIRPPPPPIRPSKLPFRLKLLPPPKE